MKKGGLPYTVYINRPVGNFIAKIVPSWVTPNMITIISFFVFCGCVVFMPFVNNFTESIILTAAFLFQYALDSADGILARRRNISSPIGEWLDHSLDGIRILVLHIAVLVTFFLNSNDFQVIHLFAVSLGIVSMGGNFITNQLKVKILNVRSGDAIASLNGFKSFMVKIIFLPADSGVYYFCFAIVHTNLFIWLYLTWSLYFFLIFMASFVFTFYQES